MTYRVMTVCTGNICRSPMAEVLLREAFAQAGLDVVVDSTGVSDEEQGNPMDRRAARVLAENGIAGKPGHLARQITAADLHDADLVLPMTANHAKAVRRLAAACGSGAEITMMRSFDPAAPTAAQTSKEEHLLDVDDPWYGGPADFQNCLAELQAAVPGIVKYVQQQIS